MKTKIHYYYFNTYNSEELAEYKKLCKKLSGMGLKLFDSISTDHNVFYSQKIKPLDNQEIELETKHLFSNQWNTAATSSSNSGLRVFDWSEGIIWANRKIKQGMWLEQTNEMKEIRDNTVKCGYCGHQFSAKKGYTFCPDCLDSEYLKETELHLLRLLPVSDSKGKRQKLTKAETDNLLPQYIHAQTVAEGSRAKAKRERQYHDVKNKADKGICAAETERDGFLWLLDNSVNIDNCIYYSHKNLFSFGWRQSVSESVKSKLLNILCEFPYEYEIK